MNTGGLAGTPYGSPKPFADILTPGTSAKKRLLIPKKSALDGRIGGTPGTPGRVIDNVERNFTGGDAISSIYSPAAGYSQRLHHRHREGNNIDEDYNNRLLQYNAPERESLTISSRTHITDLSSSLNYACWIVVFGLSESKTAARNLFSHCGEIVDSADSTGNWIFLEFKEPAGAERAMRMNGKVISSGTIIGVEQLSPSRAVELNLKVSARVTTDTNRQEFPSAREQAATPSKYLRPRQKRDSICEIIMKFFGLGG